MNCKIIVIFLSVFILFGCDSDRLNIDIQPVDFEMSVSRLDLELADAKSIQSVEVVHTKYAKAHPDFYNFYLGACLRIGLVSDTFTLNALYEFTKDEYIQGLHKEIKSEFSSMDQEVSSLKSGLSYMRHYFPKAPLPKHLIFYNSLFSNSVVSSENTIGVGLERYLGEKSASIQKLPEDPYYPYIKKRMDRIFIVRDMMLSWLSSNLLPEIKDDRELADVMVQWGKMFYALEACLPDEEKSKIIRYFPDEYEWALQNEKEFWNFLVSQNNLFKRDYKVALNLFADGPFTSGLPIGEKEQAPPRLGQFLGWRIVKNFMNENESVSLAELMDMNFKTILKSYK